MVFCCPVKFNKVYFFKYFQANWTTFANVKV